MGVFKGMQLAGLDRKSEVRQKKPGMLPIVPDQKRIPPILIEEAKNVLLEARREIAGVFADDQPSFFPELDDEPKIPADKAEAIVKKARTMIDDDTNVGFRIEDGQVKIVPEYKSVDVRKDIGY